MNINYILLGYKHAISVNSYWEFNKKECKFWEQNKDNFRIWGLKVLVIKKSVPDC